MPLPPTGDVQFDIISAVAKKRGEIIDVALAALSTMSEWGEPYQTESQAALREMLRLMNEEEKIYGE